MRIKLLLSICLLAASCQWSLAALRRVPQNYGTIPLAYNAASDGDSIIIGPGSYPDLMSFAKRLTVIGAGIELTRITSNIFLSTGCSRTVFEGIKITYDGGGTATIIANGSFDSLVFRRCMIVKNSPASGPAIAFNHQSGTVGRVFFDDCVFVTYVVGSYNSASLVLSGEQVVMRSCVCAILTSANRLAWSQAMLWGSWASLSAYNCAFLGWQALNGGGGSNTAFFNCVAYDTSTYAGEPFVWNLPPGSVVEYCASEGSVPPEAAHHIILSSNPFVNYNRTTNYVSGLTDLHLPGGSPLIDAGEPAYLDLNGTRADIGIYGGLAPFVDHGVPAYPFVSALSVPSAVSVGTPIPITATGRIGRAY